MSDRLTTPTFARRLRPVAAAALLFAVVLPGLAPAFADEVDDLRDEVEQLKQQVLFLQNQIPGAGAGGAALGGTAAAQAEVRSQQFQQQLTELTGQIERVQLKVDEVATQLERMQKDTEYRLGALEGTGGAMPPADVGAAGGGVVSDGAGPSLSGAPANGAPQEVGAGAQTTQPATPAPAPTGQPGVLGTLTTQQAANLPQAPAGAAEAAAAQAAAQTAMPTSPVVLPGDTPREQYEYATNLIQRGAYDQAEIALKSFIQQHPKDELTGNAQYWLGETYYVRNDFKGAAVAFAEGYQKYPSSQKAPDNLLKLAMALGQQGQKENACVALKQLEKRYPEASASIKDRAIKAKQRYTCS